MLAMLVSGARVSLQVGLAAVLIAIFIGATLGVASAYFGKWVDQALMRFTDLMMTFPFFLLLVLIIFLYGSKLIIIILAIALTKDVAGGLLQTAHDLVLVHIGRPRAIHYHLAVDNRM